MFCEAPAKGVRWLTPSGELLPVRCGRSNRCDYCAMLAALENALVLKLDGLTGTSRATWGVTVTSSLGMKFDPRGDLPTLLRASQTLWQGVRRAYGKQVQYCGMVEWTTGTSDASRGHRLPHIHYLVKGLPAGGIAEHELSERWRSATGSAWRVESRHLRTWAGAVAYLALHHHKAEQAPPKAVRNTKRFRPSRGFFDTPLPQLREQARAHLLDRRLAAMVLDVLDAPGVVDETTFEQLLDDHLESVRAEFEASKPRLVKLDERTVVELQFADLRESKRQVRRAK